MKTRKIFRGKDEVSGKWICWNIFEDKPNVTLETIGQNTGLTTQNGVEIYEDDIILIPESETNIEIVGVVKFDRGSFIVVSAFSNCEYSLGWVVRKKMPGEPFSKVIGNIHDSTPQECKENYYSQF